MQHFRIVHSTVHAAIAGLCWLVLEYPAELQILIGKYWGYSIPIVVTGLAVLFRTSDTLSNVIVERIPIFSTTLRRMLSGKKFIEGDWPLVVVDMEKVELLYFGFLRIEFRNGQPYVEGDDWRIDGRHAHAFHSVQSLQRDHMLQYWYEQGAAPAPEMRGYTEIFFFPKNTLAERHAGKFLDPKHTGDIRFYAKRRRYRFFERRLTSKEEKIEAARALWAEIEPRLADLREISISVDFA